MASEHLFGGQPREEERKEFRATLSLLSRASLRGSRFEVNPNQKAIRLKCVEQGMICSVITAIIIILIIRIVILSTVF